MGGAIWKYVTVNSRVNAPAIVAAGAGGRRDFANGKGRPYWAAFQITHSKTDLFRSGFGKNRRLGRSALFAGGLAFSTATRTTRAAAGVAAAGLTLALWRS